MIHDAGVSDGTPKSDIIWSIPLAFVNAVGTIITILYVDKLGRRYIILRTLPLIGLSMWFIAGSYALIGFGGYDVTGGWLCFIFILIYLAFFSIGMGATPWAVNSEIYPLHLRGIGNSCATFSNWASNYMVAQVFLTATKTATGRVITFFAIGAFCTAAWIFVYKLLPETKGKSFEEIVDELCPEAKNKVGHQKFKNETTTDTD